MKIAVIGGGSSYTPELFSGLLEFADPLGLREISLMDIDEKRLAIMSGFLSRMAAASGKNISLKAALDLKTALEKADYVIIQIRVGGQKGRLLDETIPWKFNRLGQETVGAGGFSLALRTIPQVEKIAKTAEKYAPDAVIINFTNPVSIITSALTRLGGSPVIGLCNIPMVFREKIAKILAKPAEELEISSFGLNHLTFINEVKYRGENLFAQALKGWKDKNLSREMVNSLGLIPSYYLYYYFCPEKALKKQMSHTPRAKKVMEIEKLLFARYRDPKQVKRPRELGLRGGHLYSRAAVELLLALNSPAEKELTLNLANQGAIPNLPVDKIVEIPVKVSQKGIKIPRLEPLPDKVKGLIQQVAAYEELTLQAASRKSPELGTLALLSNPLVGDYPAASGIMKAILKAHREQLPGWP